MEVLLAILFCVCLAVSFLMSGMEAGVFALSRLRIRQQMRRGSPRARALNAYLENSEDFLWTILVGNTVSSVVVFSLGVIGLYRWLEPWPALFWSALFVSGAVYYATCEFLPKMLFRFHPNRLCLALALPFGMIRLALRPLVAPMAWLARRLAGLFGGRAFTGRLFGNREEMRIVMQESAAAMSSEERAMINRVLDLQNLTVRQITVPMDRVASAWVATPLKDLVAVCRERGFSQLPVWKADGAHRRVAGLVNVTGVLYQGNLDPNRPAEEFLQPALFLDADQRLEVALRQMQRAGQRLAVVLGPDRAELGMVSLQDILSVIFGEMSL